MTEGKHSARSQGSENKESAPDHVYAGGRLGRWFGKLFGGSGRRTGARDTDPGS